MSIMQGKNLWGAAAATAGQAYDQVRSDLFIVKMNPPAIVGGLNFNDQISFAISKFPFPDRGRESIQVKYLNQTNKLVGADTALPSVTVTARQAYTTQTAQLLEEWYWATSNPNGGVALTSQIKTSGDFYWLAPVAGSTTTYDSTNVNGGSSNSLYRQVCHYTLEGVWIKSLKPSDADMTQSNGLVDLSFSVEIDRYYPQATSDLVAQI